MKDILSDISWQQQLWLLLDVTIASVLAGVVGFEREKADKPAGFRTNMIIGASAALLVGLGHALGSYFHDIEGIRLDPIRIIESIVVGVSFIGAGTIIKGEPGQSDTRVSNLTTAATILLSAGIGISVALNYYILAVGVTVLALVINLLLRNVKKWGS